MDTVARGQRSLGAAEREIDRFIEKRAEQAFAEDPDERDPGYMESVRLYHERSEAEMRQRWHEYHAHMATLHGRLSEEHAQKAEKLTVENGHKKGDAA